MLATLALLFSFNPLDAKSWKEAIDSDPDWYRSEEAHSYCEAVLAYQYPSGGWPKNHDMSHAPSATQKEKLAVYSRKGTIDNGATYSQIEFLAKYHSANQDPASREAAVRGFRFLLEAQYDNGGWPMFYPLLGSYHDNITFNDNAIAGVLNLLMDVRKGKKSYEFINDELRSELRLSLERGIQNVLDCQVRQNGKPTVWAAQHDPVTLRPAAARAFEPASLSGAESVELAKFLMRVSPPNQEIKDAIEGAMTWLDEHAIYGLELRYNEDKSDRFLVTAPDAPRMWARFYELETNRPIFTGRDSAIHYEFMEIERERRAGYAYYGTWAEKVLAKNYPEWRAKWINENGQLTTRN
ncbi:pectate lyase [Pelagicoccus albus]|uniref:Pectate lyase n=1 Tax=Pelagicoccus albus TaxID=415222 RepID=A0A7X1B5D5_9BACT|nr:pectate lyase [Pelagicoccus albus]